MNHERYCIYLGSTRVVAAPIRYERLEGWTPNREVPQDLVCGPVYFVFWKTSIWLSSGECRFNTLSRHNALNLVPLLAASKNHLCLISHVQIPSTDAHLNLDQKINR